MFGEEDYEARQTKKMNKEKIQKENNFVKKELKCTEHKKKNKKKKKKKKKKKERKKKKKGDVAKCVKPLKTYKKKIVFLDG